MPPWNSSDDTTLEVLANLGFSYSSSSVRGLPNYQPRTCRLPRTCHLDNAERALAEAAVFRHLTPIVVIVLHHYDFNCGDCYGFERFNALLDRFAHAPGYQVETLRQVAESSSVQACQMAINHLFHRGDAHWRLQRFYPRYCLVQRPLWRIFLSHMPFPWTQNTNRTTDSLEHG